MSIDYRERVAALQRQAGHEWFRIENRAPDSGSTTARLDIYDTIGFTGTSAKGFLDSIKALDAKQIDVHLNSPGGEARDAVAIYNSLKDHPAKVVMTIDGVAASAASLIAMAGDEVIMNMGSEMMVHEPFGAAVGNADDMVHLAEVLNKTADSYASIYAAKAGGTIEKWRGVMRAETWFTAQEAVDFGLADVVVKSEVPEVKSQFDFTIYNYAGRDKAPAPLIDTQTPAATVSGQTEQKEQGMSDKLVDSLRQKLGIADENADEDSILAALDERLAEKTAPPSPQNSMEPKDLQRVAEASGAVMVDKGVWAETQAKIQQGVEAAEKLRAQERDFILAQAVTDGRIPPASKPVWAAAFDKDPKGTGEVIAQLQKNVVPVEALGYGKDDDDSNLGEYAVLFPKGA